MVKPLAKVAQAGRKGGDVDLYPVEEQGWRYSCLEFVYCRPRKLKHGCLLTLLDGVESDIISTMSRPHMTSTGAMRPCCKG